MSKKIKIQIRHWLNGSVLFEYETEDNTIKATVEEAVRQHADLRYADLRSANLGSADLRSANLGSANLGYANLGYANLGYADLGSADLGSANLGYANLGSANLRSADLRYANLGYANLRSAKNSKLAIAMTRILPQGTLIGYKKCANGVIVKLEIPAKAQRSHAFGRKCRAEYAKVLYIYGAKEARSSYSSSFIYRKGETVKPEKPFSEEWTDECASGIHFYITREEAEAHL